MANKVFIQANNTKQQFINAEGFTICYGGEEGEYWGLWVLRYPDGKVIDTDIYSVDLAKKHGIEFIYQD